MNFGLGGLVKERRGPIYGPMTNNSAKDFAEAIDDLRDKQARLYASLEAFNKDVVKRVAAFEKVKLLRALYVPES
jgi:hypothetical protein